MIIFTQHSLLKLKQREISKEKEDVIVITQHWEKKPKLIQ